MKKHKVFIQAASRYKNGEFHITPVLTLSWPQEHLDLGFSFALELEWGLWVIMLGYIHNNNNHGKRKDN